MCKESLNLVGHFYITPLLSFCLWHYWIALGSYNHDGRCTYQKNNHDGRCFSFVLGNLDSCPFWHFFFFMCMDRVAYTYPFKIWLFLDHSVKGSWSGVSFPDFFLLFFSFRTLCDKSCQYLIGTHLRHNVGLNRSGYAPKET
jgi:hypothetical protein